MASLKNITELPMAESAEGLNLIVNDNGAAKQIAASAVGAQADFNVTDESSPAYIKNKPVQVQSDWAETDENSPAFIKNKPVEEYDLDITCNLVYNAEEGYYDFDASEYIVNSGTFEGIKNKILNGIIPKTKARINAASPTGADINMMECLECGTGYAPAGQFGDNPEFMPVVVNSILIDQKIFLMLLSDNTLVPN